MNVMMSGPMVLPDIKPKDVSQAKFPAFCVKQQPTFQNNVNYHNFAMGWNIDPVSGVSIKQYYNEIKQ